MLIERKQPFFHINFQALALNLSVVEQRRFQSGHSRHPPLCPSMNVTVILQAPSFAPACGGCSLLRMRKYSCGLTCTTRPFSATTMWVLARLASSAARSPARASAFNAAWAGSITRGDVFSSKRNPQFAALRFHPRSAHPACAGRYKFRCRRHGVWSLLALGP